MTANRGSAVHERRQRQAVHLGHCDACGAPMQRTLSPARWGAVQFCDNCLSTLSPKELELKRREIALRGVPLT